MPSGELVHAPCPKKRALSVFVTDSNHLLLNGKPASLEALTQALGKTGTREVCYGRADPAGKEVPPIAALALEQILASRLPLSFYLDAAMQKRLVLK